jgi:pectin-derived oligosaccharide transport system permease protein
MTTQAERVPPALLSVLRHAGLILGACVVVYPLLWMLGSSLKPEAEIFGTASIWPTHWQFDNYVKGWNGLPGTFGRFFLNSAVVSTLAVIGNVSTCSFAAYAFARLRFAGKRLWFALMLGTLMLPYHATLVPQYVLFLHLGWIDTILPLVAPKFLACDAFFIFLMVQFFRRLPRELDEAAEIDGCGPIGIYWKIILPLSTPVLATAGIFSFIWTWDDFFAPLIYLNTLDNYTVPVALSTFVDQTGEAAWGALFAMSTLAVLPVFFLFLFFQRLLIQGIATTGLRG